MTHPDLGSTQGPDPLPRRSRAAGLLETSIAELLSDLRSRYGRGEATRVEAYLESQPGLASDTEGLLDLIYQEVLLREGRGERPHVAEYLGRFPGLAGPLADLFEVHHAFRDDGTAEPDPHATVGDTPAPDPGRLEAGPAPPGEVSNLGPAIRGYRILGVLGRGGMGIVYRALDLRRGREVALKTMSRFDPSSLYRFKREFRSLLDVAHPNLVNLYELVSDGRDWFITMELVEGVPFLDYVRPAPARSVDEARLRQAFRQLVSGVAAVHAAGKLHRDLKPSNALVEPAGRVVLMDFGLATDLEASGLQRSTLQDLVGTIAYMAPEQAAGQPLTPAADWYSVGVMLYEALAGRLPYEGPGFQVLLKKHQSDPPPPRSLAAEVPPDLDALCMDLLRRDPHDRPVGSETLQRLGAVPRTSNEPAAAIPVGADALLVGRERHLAALEAAFETARAGVTTVVGLRGCSGIGKSLLLRRFLDALAGADRAVVLSGRCHERESVPFKALDGIIDVLARHLRRLPATEAAAVLPRDLGPLLRVFPVLGGVEAVVLAPRRGGDCPDPQELRRRAFLALKELLARLADRRPLVLAIDDMQWSDSDSRAALAEVLRPPDAPSLLLVACYRSEDVPSGTILQGVAADGAALRFVELEVDPLTPRESEDLALALMGRGDAATRGTAGLIARETGGNPLFVAELTRAVAERGEPGEGLGGLSLDEVLWARIERLPPTAREVLELVSVSGRPLDPALVTQCLGLAHDARGAVGLLRASRLLRSPAVDGDGEAVETYHDRVRETVLAHLDPDVLRLHHRRLAQALEGVEAADPERLAGHLEPAGERRLAAASYARAAARAARGLAFDRAARLYERALALQDSASGRDPAEARALRIGLADALANAGRGADAAHCYLETVREYPGPEDLEVRRRAALQFLISGHIDEGLATLEQVLKTIGIRLPATPRAAMLSFLLGRMRLAWRGLDFHPRDAGAIDPEILSRIDACWTAGVGLSVVDWVRGADFQTRGLRLALAAGEPGRIARALAMEAAHNATAGHSSRQRTARILTRADELSRLTGEPYAAGMVELARGVSAYLEGRWRAAVESCDAATRTFRAGCTGAAWELDTASAFALWALSHLGEIAELARRFPGLLQQARERGDLYALMNLSTYNLSVLRLANDEPDAARVEVRCMMDRWSRQGYHVQHNDQVWGAVNIELYRGDPAAAWELIRRHWPALERSLLLRVQFVRVSMLYLRARAAIASAPGCERPSGRLRVAERDARRLARERVPWALAHARVIRALVHRSRDRDGLASAELEAAAGLYETADMALCAAATRRVLGLWAADGAPHAPVDEADRWMSSQGIRNPARLAAMYVPSPR